MSFGPEGFRAPSPQKNTGCFFRSWLPQELEDKLHLKTLHGLVSGQRNWARIELEVPSMPSEYIIPKAITGTSRGASVVRPNCGLWMLSNCAARQDVPTGTIVTWLFRRLPTMGWNSQLILQTWWKTMVEAARDPSGQFITVVLLDKHIKQPSICVYSLRNVQLSTLFRETSFCSEYQWI